MSRASIFERRRGGHVALDLRAVQRAIEDGTLTAGERADIAALFPDMAGWLDVVTRAVERARELKGRVTSQRRES